jgi:thiosulfate reductase cytochrome b subunit
VFVLFPLTIMTGFAMSPAITSVSPWLVTVWGGHQSARTIHFVLADLLTAFVFVHVAMVIYAGFGSRMHAMIMGREGPGSGKETL